MIYLASPYSHEDPAVRLERFVKVSRCAARLIERGHLIYAPICMTHPIEEHMTERRPTSFWLRIDQPFMRACTSLSVLCISGWKESRGVAAEIAHFSHHGLGIEYLGPEWAD